MPVPVTTMEQFYEQRKSKLNPANIMLNQKRLSSQRDISRLSKKKEVVTPETIKVPKMDCSEKIEGDELFDFNKKDGWNFILNNLIIQNDREESPNRKKIQELVDELNTGKDINRMILADMKVGNIYKKRQEIQKFLRISPRRAAHKNIKNSQRLESIKKQLFSINKRYLSNFKSYKIKKFNILKSHEENNASIIKIIEDPQQKKVSSASINQAMVPNIIAVDSFEDEEAKQNKSLQGMVIDDQKLRASIVKEQREKIKEIKIRRLETKIRDEIKFAMNQSDKIFGGKTLVKLKPSLKKVEKCASVVSEDNESEWVSSDTEESSKYSKAENQIKLKIPILKNSDNKVRRRFNFASPPVRRNVGFSPLQPTPIESVYNDDSETLKKNLVRILRGKCAKFLAAVNSPLSQQKLKVCNNLLKFIRRGCKGPNILHMRLFPVEFSEVSELLNRYIRSLKISKINSSINEKLAVEKRVTRMMSHFNNELKPSGDSNVRMNKSIRGPMSPVIVRGKIQKKLRNSQKRTFNSIMSSNQSHKNSISLSKDRDRTFEYSKSITSWLESKMEFAKKSINTPKLSISHGRNTFEHSSLRKTTKPLFRRNKAKNPKLSTLSAFSGENFEAQFKFGPNKRKKESDNSCGEVKVPIKDMNKLVL
ncbi:unnamed protein product [Moneuplotes crassus]|uniref:Uncharacterized protein n=1 Tax=Euplotes crassus TaxID=5936 RepID=A0AAD1Y6D5_EUPCR|nr:unnamed protein product [Moneuplotes crassus]